MGQTCDDPDPYAELDNRADAAELSDEHHRPGRIFRRAAVRAPLIRLFRKPR
jgi:hypothetical protein